MNSGQVPIWITLVVAALGIIGVVAGQLVNAWREDRRWKRETDREELRYRREIQKEERRAALDSSLHWREERLSASSEFIGRLEAYRELLRLALQSVARDEVITASQFELLSAAENQILQTASRLQLVASVNTYETCMNSYYRLTMITLAIKSGELLTIHPSGQVSEMPKALRNARRALRQDLGLEPDVVNEANPSPPFDPTS